MLDAENPAEATTDATAPASGESPESPDNPPAEKTAATRPAKKAAAKKATAKKAPAKRTAKKAASAPETDSADLGEPVKRTRKTAKSAAPAPADSPTDSPTDSPADSPPDSPTGTPAETVAGPADEDEPAAPVKKAAAKRTTRKVAASRVASPSIAPFAVPTETAADALVAAEEAEAEEADEAPALTPPPATALLFQPPDPTKALPRKRKAAAQKSAQTVQSSPDEEGTDAAAEETGKATDEETGEAAPATRTRTRRTAQKTAQRTTEADQDAEAAEPAAAETTTAPEDREDRDSSDEGDDEAGGERRRRRRGGRRRRKSGGEGSDDSGESRDSQGETQPDEAEESRGGSDDDEESGAAGTRRRRRRRRAGDASDGGDEPAGTVTRVRKPRNAEDEITSLQGSTRLEAKKQRRREGREAGRRRAPIVSEAEFLARREAVDRMMVIRQKKDLTQIAVLEDKVLVEHYVARESQTSLIGNVYLGRVQNVLPSMEAAFIDIGKGRNAVLYAGEVNWDSLGAKNGTPRKIEAVLKSGQPILVQVTKDPIGHKGARLTSQVSLPGRFLVYVPDGTTSGISRKLPDTERNRLKTLLKDIVPESAGVIVRTAAEGASEAELTRDVERLTARWADIESKVNGGNAPQLLYGEPDLTLKVVRDLFTEDFGKLVVSGDEAWDVVDQYVDHVAPDLAERLERYDGDQDVFAKYRIDEQIDKALDRKVWLPSGGSLVIDRTEAMTVVDVNTGKFTGSGGNLEETVTKNNLEAAEEIVRQLRLRDIGGIIVVDFIDMVLESNRDLVLRRMVECLGRDRTRHQVAEVTSLGLVQMTRKRIGTGLLEAFTESCEHCGGRGLVVHHEPVEPKKKGSDDEPRRSSRRGGRNRGRDEADGNGTPAVPTPKDIAAMARQEERPAAGTADAEDEVTEVTEATEATEADMGTATTGGTDAGDVVAADTVEAVAATETGERTTPSRRSRGGRGRGSRTRVSEATAPTDETAPTSELGEPQSTQAPERPETEPETGTEPVIPTEPEPEREPEPVIPTEPEPEPAIEPETEPAPVGGPPAAPRVVTTVRRRSARRAAGPPPGSGAVATLTVSPGSPAVTTDEAGSPAGADSSVDGADSSVDGAVDGAEHGTDSAPHVPVKKRGSRKR